VTFNEDEAFRKSKESHMDGDQEEQEAPRDAVIVDSTPEEHILENQIETVEPKRPVVHPEKPPLLERDQLGSRTLCRKLKDMQLPEALLERARYHTSFPTMWH
jgi:hypothetical protein